MNPIIRIFKSFSKRVREKRALFFRNIFSLNENTKILDLGSGNGTNINSVLKGTRVQSKNVYIADIVPEAVAKGSKDFGFTPVIIDESEVLPFSDGFFDIVYWSSVIEHVTVPKEEVWGLYSGHKFKKASHKRQKEFSKEIKRLGKQYFVQTPYKHFPIESHSWLPLFEWLPRQILIPTLCFTNRFWVKGTSPDWCLLDKKGMSELFSEAQIIDEKVFGITKSIMAVYTHPSGVNSYIISAKDIARKYGFGI